jgi:toxin ParE1/3/4
MKVRYTETALAEIEEICSYIAQDNPGAAADIATAIERVVAWVAKRPRSAPVVYAGEVRAKLVERFQYRIFYTIKGDEVTLRNVRRTKQSRPWDRERVGIDV